MPRFLSKLRNLLTGRRRFEDDLRDEMHAHLQFEIEDSLSRGLPPETARAAAQRRFGNGASIAERTRHTWDFPWLAGLARDFRIGARSMARRPAFAAVAILSLAIALGANTAVFSFANAILLQTLPATGANRLVIMRQKNEQFHMENSFFSYAFFQALRKQAGDFEDILAVSWRDITLSDREETERLGGELVSGNYFRMLGVHPAAGRLLDEADDAVDGASPVCVISYKLWQERFGGSPAVIDRQVLLEGHPFRIVGVTQRGFTGASLHIPRDIQAPTAMAGTFFRESKRDDLGILFLIPRLKPGVTIEHAAAWLNSVGHTLQEASGTQMGRHDDFLLFDGSQGVNSRREGLGKPVIVLLLLVGVLLLAACANLSALLLVRSVERAREAGIRAAIGASRFTLFRQFLAEAMLLAAAGGALGWALALALIRVLLGLMPDDKLLAQFVHPGATVFAFTAALTLLTALLFGLLPAWRASRADPLPAIHGAAFAARGSRQRLLSSAVIAAQIALSLALVFCAGLFSRTLHNLRAIDLGFDSGKLVILPVELAQTPYASEASPFYAELLRRVRAQPETRAASLTSLTAVSGGMRSTIFTVPGYASPNGMRPTSYTTRVSSGYFRTMGTPLLAGRDFINEDTDGRNSEGAVIVNEQFARQFFAGYALGKTFVLGARQNARIVGIVRTSKYLSVREEPQPVIYLPIAPGSLNLDLQVRVTGNLNAAIERLRAAVRSLGPRAPIGAITTMEMQLDEALSRERLLAFLSTLLGAVAAALAAIGLYGALSFAVTRRTKEIGIRLSVGAQRSAIVALFLRESAWIAAIGVALGIPLMLSCGKLADSLLYGLPGEDSQTAILAAAALIILALLAGFIPSARAAAVDPVRALKHD
jgi:predicted permease